MLLDFEWKIALHIACHIIGDIMVLYTLNYLLLVFLIATTVIANNIEQHANEETNPFITNILILTICIAMWDFSISLNGYITGSLMTLLLKMTFLMEMCFLVNLTFCFAYQAWGVNNTPIYIIKFALYAFAAYFIFFRLKSISADPKRGLVVTSNYLFPDQAINTLFPFTWNDLFVLIFRVAMPITGCLMMLIRQETTGTKLARYKGYIYAVALVVTWLDVAFIHLISVTFPAYSLLCYFVYVPLTIITCHGSWVTNAPSKKHVALFAVKSFFLYVVPAVLLGAIFSGVHTLFVDYGAVAAIGVIVIVAGFGTLISNLYRPIRNLKFFHNNNYVQAFESDLASIDYSGEMDDIAASMYQIFRRNVESESLAVYINAGNATFQNAYTSTGERTNIDKYEPLFEQMLNIGRNIVARSELESVHILAPFKNDLAAFFHQTHGEVLFILNEGRDVHGIIFIGKKSGVDHYSEKDLEVFNKLYSYLFVFGYYMRNISNKEVIGTVNRELRMSAQIITSIQENIDNPKNDKVDVGCIMTPAHNIGGEFVDMVRLTDTRHLFVMGSLSGKGIAASMSMVILKAIIRAYLAETHDFKTLVVKVNQFVRYNLQKGSVFSGMFAILDFETDTFYYINCGIPAVLLYTEAYNNVIEIEGAGHILGFVHDISPYIEVKQTKLHKNDIILASTAGLIESHSLRGEQFGKDRIQRNLVANRMYPAQRMTVFEQDELNRFMAHEMENDVTLLIIKYLKTSDNKKRS